MNNQCSVCCNTQHLKDVRKFVLQVLKDYECSESDQNLIVLAVDEICSNLMIHSNKCNESESITLKAEDQNGRLTFEIIDRGDAFNPSHYMEPNIKDVVNSRRKGGFGLMLVRRIMDHIEYDKKDGLNVCRLSKQMH